MTETLWTIDEQDSSAQVRQGRRSYIFGRALVWQKVFTIWAGWALDVAEMVLGVTQGHIGRGPELCLREVAARAQLERYGRLHRGTKEERIGQGDQGDATLRESKQASKQSKRGMVSSPDSSWATINSATSRVCFPFRQQ
jgi:hypothetical protein